MMVGMIDVVGQAGSRPRARGRGPAAQVALLAGAAAVCWLPFLGVTLTRDEAGLLMIGGQWSPGASLYGDYWVDRPPLLITLFAGISMLGDAPAVRLLGALAAAVSVAAAAGLGRALAPRDPKVPVALAGVVAVATATPLMGAGAVNAEILAVPFVLAGLWAMVSALGSPGAATWLALLAGLLGASAALVKQNFVDVFVFAAAALLVHARGGRENRRRALPLAAAVATGGLLACVAVLGLASLLGSDPDELWDAIVVFRGEASEVLAAAATAATAQRFAILVAALLATALPVVVLTLVPALLGPRTTPAPQGSTDLRLPAAAVLTWELVGVLLGGSYWLHYLLALVPGIALLVGVALQRHPSLGRGFRVAVALAAVSTVVAIVVNVVHPEHVPEQAAIDYLRAHAGADDTGIVAFGAPNILQAAGLTSPYPHLWSLPVRVRDSRLESFAAVLAGPDRPDWLVVAGSSIATWGVDERAAQPLVRRYYTYRAAAGTFGIYHVKEAHS